MRSRPQSPRPWLALLGILLAVGVLLPPGETLARRYVFAQAVQFAVIAFVVPALLALGAPWQLIGRRPATGSTADRTPPAGRRFLWQAAEARSHRPGGGRAWAILIGFIAVVVAWRTPAAVNATVRYPALLVAEAATLITLGCGLWLELAGSPPPPLPAISRPQRAALAALPMWVTWALAYILAFSQSTWFSAFSGVAGRGLGMMADQQIAAGLLWAISGLCFVPVVFVSLLGWLRDAPDQAGESRPEQATRMTDQPGTPRPPRGWRLPSA